MTQSVETIIQVATTSSSSKVSDCIIPFWMNIRVAPRGRSCRA